MFRSLLYKVIRGVIHTAIVTPLVALPVIGWIALPIVEAVGKAIRVRWPKMAPFIPF